MQKPEYFFIISIRTNHTKPKLINIQRINKISQQANALRNAFLVIFFHTILKKLIILPLNALQINRTATNI
jgi:hypothetical protein